MPATTTATLTGAQTDQAVFEQFQQVPLRLWTKNQLAAATNMGYARISRSVDRLVASGQVTLVSNQVFRGGDSWDQTSDLYFGRTVLRLYTYILIKTPDQT